MSLIVRNCITGMPVTFKVATHDANPVEMGRAPISTATDLLSRSWGAKTRTLRCAEMLQSSLHSSKKEDISRIRPQSNGFVDTFLAAYNQHHHLSVRFVYFTANSFITNDLKISRK